MTRVWLIVGGAFALCMALLGALAFAAADDSVAGTTGTGAPRADVRGRVAMAGLNASGAEFAPKTIPGVLGKTYVYPTERSLRGYAALGVQVVRLPIRWERLQPALSGPLDAAQLAQVDATVRTATAADMVVILDLHNYGRYRGALVTEPAVSAGLADVWRRLATTYKGRKVAFGLMTEPFGIGARDWRRVAERAVGAIRATSATNLILVPGTRWTGAHSWSAGGEQSNAAAFAGFRDRNFAYEMHQYLDRRSAGTTFDCPGGAEVGVRRLTGATEWLRRQHARGFLGEFAAGHDPACQTALAAMLDHMDRNSDVWLGWTYWTAGPWWPARYEFGVEPRDGRFPAQATALTGWFARR